LGGLAPQHVYVGRIDQPARDSCVQASFISEEAIVGALAGEELNVADVTVSGEQFGAVGVCACYEHRGNAANVCRQTGGNQLLHKFLRGNQDLSAQVSALLGGGKLIFKVDSAGAGFDHGLHQLKGVQGATKSGFSVGHDRSEPVDAVLAFRVMNLVGANE